jgi:hypothetical protein
MVKVWSSTVREKVFRETVFQSNLPDSTVRHIHSDLRMEVKHEHCYVLDSGNGSSNDDGTNFSSGK